MNSLFTCAGRLRGTRTPDLGRLSGMKALHARARAHLKGLAHGLSPVVQVGSSGLTPEIDRATSVALEDHELIKVRLGSSFEGDRKVAARELADRVGGALVQLIGRVVILYRRRARDMPSRPRIELPSGE